MKRIMLYILSVLALGVCIRETHASEASPRDIYNLDRNLNLEAAVAHINTMCSKMKYSPKSVILGNVKHSSAVSNDLHPSDRERKHGVYQKSITLNDIYEIYDDHADGLSVLEQRHKNAEESFLSLDAAKFIGSCGLLGYGGYSLIPQYAPQVALQALGMLCMSENARFFAFTGLACFATYYLATGSLNRLVRQDAAKLKPAYNKLAKARRTDFVGEQLGLITGMFSEYTMRHGLEEQEKFGTVFGKLDVEHAKELSGILETGKSLQNEQGLLCRQVVEKFRKEKGELRSDNNILLFAKETLMLLNSVPMQKKKDVRKAFVLSLPAKPAVFSREEMLTILQNTDACVLLRSILGDSMSASGSSCVLQSPGGEGDMKGASNQNSNLSALLSLSTLPPSFTAPQLTTTFSFLRPVPSAVPSTSTASSFLRFKDLTAMPMRTDEVSHIRDVLVKRRWCISAGSGNVLSADEQTVISSNYDPAEWFKLWYPRYVALK